MRILVVEDNRRLAANLQRALELEGYAAGFATPAPEGCLTHAFSQNGSSHGS
jgi:DNA-binding response OmpR family regulator